MATIETTSTESAATGHESHDHPPFLAHHFDTPQQQFDSGKLGIWLFLITEMMFFGGLFVAYAVYRNLHPEIFHWGHQFLDVQWGAINTGVLIFSSLTMAWAVRCAQLGQQRGLVACVSITLICAAVFLGIKYVEYSHKIHDGLLPGRWFDPVFLHHDGDGHASETGHDESHASHDHGEASEGHGHGHAIGEPPLKAHLFFSIYFCMTGLHAIHIIAGMGVLGWILRRSIRGDFGPQYFGPVDYVGLYWHLVDLIWIYLFPLLYLIR